MVTLLVIYRKNELPDYYLGAIMEYSKRLKRYCNLILQEVESQSEVLPLVSSSYTFRVYAKGKVLDSVSFSKKIQDLTLNGYSKIAFVVNMKVDTDDTLSLTTLDMSDDLSVVCMLEQIYRAFRIWYGEPYHK